VNAQYWDTKCPDENCDGESAGIPNYPDVDTIWYNPCTESICNMDDMIIDGFAPSSPFVGFDNYAYVVTGPIDPIQDKRPIVGVTYDGTWDFGLDGIEGRPYGSYCFTGFGYYQGDIDALADNFIFVGVVCQCYAEEEQPCVKGDEDLEEIMDIIVNNDNSICPESDVIYDIDTVLCILRKVVEPLVPDICVAVAPQTYCVEYAELPEESCNCSVGISSIKDNFGTVNIYPNPISSAAKLEFASDINAMLTIDVYDITGKLVQSSKEQAYVGLNQFDVNANSWNSGFYYAKISSEKDVVAVKFLKD